ncbi:MAG TPA: VWA domain-containing protein [Terriglobales bacterium]|nr:VWA domain-containing protein [Terriglobales bacterium]
MTKLRGNVFFVLFIVFIVLTGIAGLAAQSPQEPQKVPDAPSATRPAPTTPFPTGTKPAPVPQPERPAEPASTDQQTVPPANTSQLPRVTRTPGQDSRDDFTLTTSVNFVTVPVTVKDADGRLVDGLVRNDFAVYEDGEPQNLRLFTSDPFPLSVALVIDQGMSATAMNRVNETFQGMLGAFSQFDEVGVYAYDNNVRQIADFQGAGDPLLSSLRRTKRPGRQGGVPVVGGPMNSGPTINGRPADPGARTVNTPVRETHALNDAILRAAQDLSKREKARRRIIFLISDGQELDSSASYSEVLKVLLSNEIIVYSIGVDSAAIPGLEKLGRIRVPRQGTNNLLPKYVSATGGEHFAEFTRASIEAAYARLTEVARNQYTLGYTTRGTVASTYRTIEVRVKRPGLKVYARDGYYPLPRRPSPQ